MIKHGIDQDALITQFSQATAKQGEALRQAVHEATLKALKGRELTLANIRQVLGTVTQAAATGAAGSSLPGADVERLLAQAFGGMDAALEKAVQAHRGALQQMLDQGASLRDAPLKKALADIEKMEDTLFAAVRKAAGAAQDGPWAAALNSLQGKSTGTGAQVAATLETLTDAARTSLRDSRALGLKASEALLTGYTALVSGVLIGLSQALQQGAGAPAAAASRPGRR